MGYFLSMAKFHPNKRGTYLWTGLLLAMLAHGLFDWLLMVSDSLGAGIGSLIYIAFLVGDFYLWKIGLKYIYKQQENSRQQAKVEIPFDYNDIISNTGYDSEYKRIDWNAGDKW